MTVDCHRLNQILTNVLNIVLLLELIKPQVLIWWMHSFLFQLQNRVRNRLYSCHIILTYSFAVGLKAFTLRRILKISRHPNPLHRWCLADWTEWKRISERWLESLVTYSFSTKWEINSMRTQRLATLMILGVWWLGTFQDIPSWQIVGTLVLGHDGTRGTGFTLHLKQQKSKQICKTFFKREGIRKQKTVTPERGETNEVIHMIIWIPYCLVLSWVKEKGWQSGEQKVARVCRAEERERTLHREKVCSGNLQRVSFES